MNRHALLIGNLDAEGTQNDIYHWRQFLLSGIGGAWSQDEIETLTNPRKCYLEMRLNSIKVATYDFVFVIYAGHGGWERATILEINPQQETINEIQLKGLALREILVLDCCRATSTLYNIITEANLMKSSDQIRNNIRKRYEQRQMESIPQQVTLYACLIGESAYCTNEGGYYTRNLIQQCTSVPAKGFQTINQAHNAAALATTEEVAAKEKQKQHPEISTVRCLTCQQLIIGISI